MISVSQRKMVWRGMCTSTSYYKPPVNMTFRAPAGAHFQLSHPAIYTILKLREFGIYTPPPTPAPRRGKKRNLGDLMALCAIKSPKPSNGSKNPNPKRN